jgi:hypothetical protein
MGHGKGGDWQVTVRNVIDGTGSDLTSTDWIKVIIMANQRTLNSMIYYLP